MTAYCCPCCRGNLDAALLCGECGTAYPSLDGVPVLMPDADLVAIDLRATGGALPTYDSANMGIPYIDEALRRGDAILEIGAGLDVNDSPDMVTTDAFVYGTEHLDVVADAHRLPFPDASFDFVFSLAVYEHLHSPWLATNEVARVLRPGGGVYTLCAFMQPLHGYPDHYFNATESGLRRLFSDDFEVHLAGPSRHCPHAEALVSVHRMREMAGDLSANRSAPLRSRLRARRLGVALRRTAREYSRLAEQMTQSPGGFAAWRQIAPAVEVYATRPSAS